MTTDQELELQSAVDSFSTYEEYLDSLLTNDDLNFLQDKALCRDLLALGYHSSKRIIPKDLFVRRKAEKKAEFTKRKEKALKLCSKDKDISEPLMQALAEREEDNLMGRLLTIIFIRDENEKGDEISSYIDYALKLRTEDWELYFSGEKKIVPTETDLSFYNWKKAKVFSTSTPNFDVVTDMDSHKMYFVCKKDGYPVDVSPESRDVGGSVIRYDVDGTLYSQAVIFDHVCNRPIP
ncbi:cilia- and flagella-associated protein 299-like [Stegodyphus dumicola]|uniref:cilia- and flagella-associated protein 299-like n=1 Tax=Stegodyphus dumicola TaxID=202533 RepID=UPI0015A8ECCD|nr:cilia- and flagella-associated protein 299-like [Stegodyphus dumicola]